MMITDQRLERKNLPATTVHYGEKSYVNEEGRFISDDIEIMDEEKDE